MILSDRFGTKILAMLEIKGQVLHCVRVHLKVPSWFSDLNALLTRKLPMFLSRLNEISGGGGKICLVSGQSRRRRSRCFLYFCRKDLVKINPR